MFVSTGVSKTRPQLILDACRYGVVAWVTYNGSSPASVQFRGGVYNGSLQLTTETQSGSIGFSPGQTKVVDVGIVEVINCDPSKGLPFKYNVKVWVVGG